MKFHPYVFTKIKAAKVLDEANRWGSAEVVYYVKVNGKKVKGRSICGVL